MKRGAVAFGLARDDRWRVTGLRLGSLLITTRKQSRQRERNAFELGRDSVRGQ